MEDEGYMNNLAGYTSSIIQDFESYLRTEVDLVEDDIRLLFGENFSNFNTHQITPHLYTLKDLSEVLARNLQLEFDGSDNVIDI